MFVVAIVASLLTWVALTPESKELWKPALVRPRANSVDRSIVFGQHEWDSSLSEIAFSQDKKVVAIADIDQITLLFDDKNKSARSLHAPSGHRIDWYSGVTFAGEGTVLWAISADSTSSRYVLRWEGNESTPSAVIPVSDLSVGSQRGTAHALLVEGLLILVVVDFNAAKTNVIIRTADLISKEIIVEDFLRTDIQGNHRWSLDAARLWVVSPGRDWLAYGGLVFSRSDIVSLKSIEPQRSGRSALAVRFVDKSHLLTVSRKRAPKWAPRWKTDGPPFSNYPRKKALSRLTLIDCRAASAVASSDWWPSFRIRSVKSPNIECMGDDSEIEWELPPLRQ